LSYSQVVLHTGSFQPSGIPFKGHKYSPMKLKWLKWFKFLRAQTKERLKEEIEVPKHWIKRITGSFFGHSKRPSFFFDRRFEFQAIFFDLGMEGGPGEAEKLGGL